MAQTIKVRRMMGQVGQEKITELNLQEAKKLIENCYKLNCLVFDTKTCEVIREMTPNVDEITILRMVVGGG